MIFKNFEVTPLGNAQLSINQNGNLKVNNIGNSGLDGFTVNVINHNNVKIFYNEITGIVNQGSIRHTTLSKNSINQVVTTNEKVEWFDQTSNSVKIGYNMSLMPNQYTLYGTLNGVRVFELLKQNPLYPTLMPGEPVTLAVIGLCIAGAALITAVYVALKPSHYSGWTYDYNAKGECIGKHWTTLNDPVPFEVIVDGQTYIVDQFGIEYAEIPEDPNYYKIVTKPTAVQITGINLNSLEVTNII